MAFQVGQVVRFAGVESVVREVGTRGGAVAYRIENGPEQRFLWPHLREEFARL